MKLAEKKLHRAHAIKIGVVPKGEYHAGKFYLDIVDKTGNQQTVWIGPLGEIYDFIEEKIQFTQL